MGNFACAKCYMVVTNSHLWLQCFFITGTHATSASQPPPSYHGDPDTTPHPLTHTHTYLLILLMGLSNGQHVCIMTAICSSFPHSKSAEGVSCHSTAAPPGSASDEAAAWFTLHGLLRRTNTFVDHTHELVVHVFLFCCINLHITQGNKLAQDFVWSLADQGVSDENINGWLVFKCIQNVFTPFSIFVRSLYPTSYTRQGVITRTNSDDLRSSPT